MDEQKEVELKINPPCLKCGSGQVYLRITTFERVCRMCGFIEKLGVKQ